jgi:hypothetical protein
MFCSRPVCPLSPRAVQTDDAYLSAALDESGLHRKVRRVLTWLVCRRSALPSGSGFNIIRANLSRRVIGARLFPD